MSGDDGLREALAVWLADTYESAYQHAADEPDFGCDVDAVLALPEVAALRAKAAAADRVRELHRPSDRGTGPQCQGCATHVSFRPWPCPTILELDGDGA